MAYQERTYRRGQRLFSEGQPAMSMFFIKQGTVSIRKSKGQGHVEIARVFSNEVLGELAFFDRRPRSATAIAITDVVALEIDFESLDAIYSKVPEYLRKIINSVADRLRKATETIRVLQKNVIVHEDDSAEGSGQEQENTSSLQGILAQTSDISFTPSATAPAVEGATDADIASVEAEIAKMDAAEKNKK